MVKFCKIDGTENNRQRYLSNRTPNSRHAGERNSPSLWAASDFGENNSHDHLLDNKPPKARDISLTYGVKRKRHEL